MKVTKAVIPAAGLGTRVLPATKAMPKEMLTIVDKPAIQYIVEEAVRSGITDILIITNRGKGVIEDHFDRCPELEERLLASGKKDVYDEVVGISKLANIFFIRQKETKGLGHAVSCAKNFVGNEPFAVLYGDDVIIGEDPACGQLIRAYEEFGKAVVGILEVGQIHIDKPFEAAQLFNRFVAVAVVDDRNFYLRLVFGKCFGYLSRKLCRADEVNVFGTDTLLVKHKFAERINRNFPAVSRARNCIVLAEDAAQVASREENRTASARTRNARLFPLVYSYTGNGKTFNSAKPSLFGTVYLTISGTKTTFHCASFSMRKSKVYFVI